MHRRATTNNFQFWPSLKICAKTRAKNSHAWPPLRLICMQKSQTEPIDVSGFSICRLST